MICRIKMAAAAAGNWRVHFTQLSSPLFRRKSVLFCFKTPSPVKRTHSYVIFGNNGKKNGEILRKSSFVLGIVLGSYVGLWFYNRRKRVFIKTRALQAKDIPNLNSILETPNRVGSKSKQFNFVADVVEIIAPAVVHIECHGGRSDGFLGHNIMVPSSSGSGFLVTEDGLVLTNAHVVKNMSNVKVTLADGSKLVGDIVSFDEALDLAAVQLRNQNKVNMWQCKVAFTY